MKDENFLASSLFVYSLFSAEKIEVSELFKVWGLLSNGLDVGYFKAGSF